MATTFETDWDPYFDDIDLFGIEHCVDWMQHTTQYSPSRNGSSTGGVEKFSCRQPRVDAHVKQTVGGFNAIRSRCRARPPDTSTTEH